MSRLLGSLGGAAAAHPWRTVAAWLSALAVALVLAGTAGGTPHDDYEIPGLPSQAAADLLEKRFPELSGTHARAVVHDPAGRPLDPKALEELRARLGGVPGAVQVGPPRLSADRDTALLEVRYRIKVTDLQGSEGVDALEAAAGPTERAGLTVAFGGEVPENLSVPNGAAEAVGVAAALAILLVALGSVVAAGLPLAVALAGLGVGASLVTLLAAVTEVSTTAPTVATMVGLGVGIDYALLLVARQVEGLRAGLEPRPAAAAATRTAGRSVLMAGATVLVSLFGLGLSGLPVYATFGYTTFFVVSAVMLAAVTLVPALCALAGRRLLSRAERRAAPVPGAVRQGGAPRTERWARRVAARPVASALAATVVLLALAAPVLGMRTWPQDAGSKPGSHTARIAYDLVTEEFGPGANGPLVLAVDLREFPPAGLARLAARLDGEPGVANVTTPVVNARGDAAVIAVEPDGRPNDPATARLIDRLRGDVLPDGVLVGGVAVFADISDLLSRRLWLVVAFVVGLSVLLLGVLLRAPVVAAKAALMNLLSVGAAYGVVTVLFQTDAGARLVGLPYGAPVSSWIPILMFAILFGLSMDYEVFLLSRVREAWLAGHGPTGSVVHGLSATGRVITSGAAIMVAVFVGFALDPDVTVKTLGVGLAVAVLIDATVIRMVLVPATMVLLGRANWWPAGRSGPSPAPPSGDGLAPAGRQPARA